MATLLVIVLAPIAFALGALYTVLKLTALLLRLIFAPVVWMSRQEPRRKVKLTHYR
jgi:hypothetical protein